MVFCDCSYLLYLRMLSEGRIENKIVEFIFYIYYLQFIPGIFPWGAWLAQRWSYHNYTFCYKFSLIIFFHIWCYGELKNNAHFFFAKIRGVKAIKFQVTVQSLGDCILMSNDDQVLCYILSRNKRTLIFSPISQVKSCYNRQFFDTDIYAWWLKFFFFKSWTHGCFCK